jgi:hypothetical protein
MMIRLFDQPVGRSWTTIPSSSRQPLRQGCSGVPARRRRLSAAGGLARERSMDTCGQTSSNAIVVATLFAGGSVVMQAIDQTNPASSRAIAVTTTWLSLPFAIM